MFAARLRAYAPGGASLGLLPDPLSWQASIVHGDLGALTVTYSTLTAGGPLIARPMAEGVDGGLEVALEVWDGATWVEPRGCRFVRVAQGADTADEMEVYSITFRSYGWLLSKARLTDGTFTDGRRVFPAPLAGELVGDILAENASIGGVPVSVIGGGSTDAGGASWPALPDQGFDYAGDYLGIVRGLQEAGALDWATQARGLYLYLPDSASLSPDLSATVRLRLGLDIGQAPADETIELLVSEVAVRAQAGGTVVVDDPAAPVPWGKWQGSLAVGQVDNQSAAEAMGEAELERSGRAREQYTRDLVLHDGAPIPLVDYWPGSWITAPTSVPAESVRVQQVTLTFGDGGYGGNVVLNDRLVEGDIWRARTLGTLAGGQVGAGGAPAPIVTDPEASRIPSTPTGLTRSAALTFTGPTPRGIVTASWNAVTTATDSGPLTISGYELQWQIGAGAWQTIFTPEVSAQIPNLTPGDSVTVRVRAVGARTTLPSAYATAAAIVVPGDVTAPSVPTGLTVTSALRIVSATWAGTLTAAIPADFARVEVAAGLTSTPTTVVGVLTRAGTLQITGASLAAAIGATVWVRLRSVDTTGNASAYGTAVSVVVAGVAGPDLAANSVTANTIAVGALDGKIITGATIRTASSGDRLEMTTAGLIAWFSGDEAVELLPGGITIHDGGELVVEYGSGTEALRVGVLESSPSITTGIRLSGATSGKFEFYNLSGTPRVYADGLGSFEVLNTTTITLAAPSAYFGSAGAHAFFDGGGTPAFDLITTGAGIIEGDTVALVGGSGGPTRLDMDVTSAEFTTDGATGLRHLTTSLQAGVTTAGSSGDYTFIANDRGVYIGHLTTGNPANMWISSTDGQVRRATSSLRYKQDVEPLVLTPQQVLQLRPVTWRDRNEVLEDPATTKRYAGWIAEEVHAIDDGALDIFVAFDQEGLPDALHEPRFSAAQQLVLIDHEARLTDALTRLAALEAA
jgi:hypothetical protein